MRCWCNVSRIRVPLSSLHICCLSVDSATSTRECSLASSFSCSRRRESDRNREIQRYRSVEIDLFQCGTQGRTRSPWSTGRCLSRYASLQWPYDRHGCTLGRSVTLSGISSHLIEVFLSSGTPMISLPLETLASRVGASLLHTLGCPELVAASYDDYENIAVRLGNDSAYLKSVRAKVWSRRLKCPLFNTALYTQHLEQLFIQMWKRYMDNLLPEHILPSTVL